MVSSLLLIICHLVWKRSLGGWKAIFHFELEKVRLNVCGVIDICANGIYFIGKGRI